MSSTDAIAGAVNGGVSFWYAQAGLPVPREPLAGDAAVDVAVVGGGYTGLWTAYQLLKRDPSLDVLVVEQEIAGFGASGRNGGWCVADFPLTPAILTRRYGRDAAGTTNVVSEGSDKFRSGKVVTLPVVDGHRDTNDTACPGSNLYASLPAIRNRAAEIIAAAQAQPMTITSPSTLAGRPLIGRTVSVTRGAVSPADAAQPSPPPGN